MAIAFDNSAVFNCNNGTDNNAYTTGSGVNRMMLVGISNDRSSSNSVSYNGVSLTSLTSVTYPSAVNKLELFYLIAPATGSNTLTVTTSPGANAAVVVMTYSGVKQSGFPDASNTGSGNGVTTLGVSVTSTVNNCWPVGVFGTGSDTTTYSAGANTTIRSQGDSGGTTHIAGVDRNAAVSPAGSATLTCTPGPVGHLMAGIVASIAPFVSTTTNKSLTQTATAVVSLGRSTIFVRSLTQTATAVVSLAKNMTYLRAITVTATAAVSLSKVLVRVVSLVATAIGITALAKSIIYLFTKVARPTGTSTPVARPSSSYSKVAKPTSSWTKVPRNLT